MERTPIEWKRVKSTQIDSVCFNVKEQSLLIKFKKGAIWLYTPFTFKEYGEFLNSESVGRYFHSEIKDVKTAKRIM